MVIVIIPGALPSLDVYSNCCYKMVTKIGSLVPSFSDLANLILLVGLNRKPMTLFLSLFTQPPPSQAGNDTNSVFERITAGLNLEFLFSQTGLPNCYILGKGHKISATNTYLEKRIQVYITVKQVIQYRQCSTVNTM